MGANDLTTLDRVSLWLRSGGGKDDVSQDDDLIRMLISQVSAVCLSSVMHRPTLFSQTLTQNFDGRGNYRQTLDLFPVTAVSAVSGSFGTQVIPQATGNGNGWRLSEAWNGMPPGRQATVNLQGYAFGGGQGAGAITYTAGYLVSAEAATIPASGKVLTAQPYGIWGADSGVTYASSGIALTKVTGSPAVGQYAVDPSNLGSYIFNASEFGTAVLISYSFVPAAVEEAVIEAVGERYRYRKRIGMSSVNVAGTSTTYSLKDLPDFVKLALQPFAVYWPSGV